MLSLFDRLEHKLGSSARVRAAQLATFATPVSDTKHDKLQPAGFVQVAGAVSSSASMILANALDVLDGKEQCLVPRRLDMHNRDRGCSPSRAGALFTKRRGFQLRGHELRPFLGIAERVNPS